jgi:serine/threonine protein kinase
MAARNKLEAGTIFAGDFRIVRPLAEGGMGAVYVVEQLSTGHARALKVMLPEMADDERSRGRFAQEARVGAQIRSAHVVEVAAAGIDEATGTPWLAMELLEGEDLAALMKRRGPLEPAEAREIFDQLGDALGRAHAAGVVHRDLKPENIFISASRLRGVPFLVKVLDFGIAAILSDRKASVTVTSVVGSPLWMAPEQTNRGAKVGPATDVWAVGLIAFHTLTGRYFWESANVPEEKRSLGALFVDIMVNPIVAASRRAAALGVERALPEGFDAWFARCVTREVSERFADGAEAMAALSAVLSPEAADPLAATVLPTSTRPPSFRGTPSATAPEPRPPAPSPPVASPPVASAAFATSQTIVASDHSYVLGPTAHPAPSLAPPVAPVPSTPAPSSAAPVRGNRIWLIAAVSALTSALVVGGYVLYDDDDETPAADAGAPNAAPSRPTLAVDAAVRAPRDVVIPDRPAPAAVVDATVEASVIAHASTGEGNLEVRCHPRCRVSIDDVDRGRNPRSIILPAGPHQVTAVRGDRTLTRTVEVVADETTRTEFEFNGDAEDPSASEPETPSTPTPAPAPTPAVVPPARLPARPSRDDVDAAMHTIQRAARSCGGQGTVVVNVAFAGDGHMISASVEGQYAHTPIGACIVRGARDARVPPFAQPSILVASPITL